MVLLPLHSSTMDQYANYLYAINERPQKQQGTLKSNPALLRRASLFTASFQSCFSMMNNNKNHRTVIPRQISQYGTIPILRQHIFELFLTPPIHYVSSINIVLNIFKNCHFANSPTLSFCWRNIGWFLSDQQAKSHLATLNSSWSWMRTVGHHFAFSSLEKIYTKLFSLYFFQIFWFSCWLQLSH